MILAPPVYLAIPDILGDSHISMSRMHQGLHT